MSAGGRPQPEALFRAFFEALEAQGATVYIVRRDLAMIRAFLDWVAPRGCTHPFDVTPAHLEAYQLHLAAQPGRNGPMKPPTIRHRLTRIKRFYRWLTRRGDLADNPFTMVTLPSVPRQYTRQGLSHAELERVLAVPDLDTPNGLRVRAILETFYSTGLRQSEMIRLMLHDVDPAAGLVFVRLGKGRKDRVVPIGASALHFIDRYLSEVRPHILTPPDSGHLFLTKNGVVFRDNGALASMVRRYYNKAGIAKEGACHLLRHSAATHMLQGGADIRHIQAFLGHAQLETTSTYTRLECSDLRDVLKRCHPAERSTEPTR